MDIKKLVPWNWFKKEEENVGKTVPVRREGAPEQGLTSGNPLQQVHREIDRLFDGAFPGFGLTPFGFDQAMMPRMADGMLKPTLDLGATDKDYTITVEIPGVNEKDIKRSGALNGLKVLDLTRVLAGPVCTMLLADMGAEVIKLEVPGTGDDSRGFPPFKEGESTYFINNNRNKKSIVLNLKDPSDHGKLVEIIKSMDVLVENFRPGTMEKLGLGYEDLKETNSRLIYASISGFGQYGPYKGKPGYDIIGQAMGGIMSITGWPDGPPTRTGTAIADFLSALFCTIGILSALNARKSSGKGQKIDVSIVDSVVTAIGTILQLYLAEGRIPKRAGNKYSFIAPYEAFKAKDGWFVLGVGSESIWKKFCKTIDKEDLIDDKRFTLNADRIKNNPLIAHLFYNIPNLGTISHFW